MLKRIVFMVIVLATCIPDMAAGIIGSTTLNGVKYVAQDDNTAYVASVNEGVESITIRSAITYNNLEYKVTAVAARALYGNTTVKTVVYNSNLTTIGDAAFSGCTSLESFYCYAEKKSGFNNIASTITSIGQGAFRNCTSLVNLWFDGTSAKYIGSDAFSNCGFTILRVVNYNPSTNNTGCFSNNASLIQLVFENCSKITYGMFEGCSSLASVRIPAGIGTIDERAFFNCNKLTKATISTATQYIKEQAFGSLADLTFIENETYPSNTVIYPRAFYNCDLTSLTITEGLRIVNPRAFEGCSKLKTLIFDNQAIVTSNNNGQGFADLLGYSKEALEEVLITGNITSIPARFFKNWTMKTFGYYNGECNLTSIGDEAFMNCTDLQELNLPLTPQSLGNGCFRNVSCPINITNTSSAYYGESAKGAFVGAASTEVNINIESASSVCLLKYMPSLQTVTLSGLTTSNSFYVYECPSLTSINVINSTTYKTIDGCVYDITSNELSYIPWAKHVVTVDPTTLSLGARVFQRNACTVLDCRALDHPLKFTRNNETTTPIILVGAGMKAKMLADKTSCWNTFADNIIETSVPGDVDGDGRATISDVPKLVQKLLQQ